MRSEAMDMAPNGLYQTLMLGGGMEMLTVP